MNKIGAIVLAAGKGKRMKSKLINKVALRLANKQIIIHTIDLLKNLNISNIIVVVGFAKRSVMQAVGSLVIFAEQKKKLGTAHAVSCALKKLDKNIKDVLVLNGDDSFFYKEKLIANLIKKHVASYAAITFLTIELDNPFGLGRIIRNNSGDVIGIIEEKDAPFEFKKIKEVNPGCYAFDLSFLNRYLGKIKKSKATSEYYLTSLIDIAIKNNQKVETLKGGKLPWRGINTMEELKTAEKMFLKAG